MMDNYGSLGDLNSPTEGRASKLECRTWFGMLTSIQMRIMQKLWIACMHQSLNLLTAEERSIPKN